MTKPKYCKACDMYVSNPELHFKTKVHQKNMLRGLRAHNFFFSS